MALLHCGSIHVLYGTNHLHKNKWIQWDVKLWCYSSQSVFAMNQVYGMWKRWRCLGLNQVAFYSWQMDNAFPSQRWAVRIWMFVVFLRRATNQMRWSYTWVVFTFIAFKTIIRCDKSLIQVRLTPTLLLLTVPAVCQTLWGANLFSLMKPSVNLNLDLIC